MAGTRFLRLWFDIAVPSGVTLAAHCMTSFSLGIYRDGQYLRQSFTCDATGDHLEITMNAPEGRYLPWFKEVRFTIHGIDTGVNTTRVDGGAPALWKAVNHTLLSDGIPWDRNAHKIRIAFPQR